MRLSRLSYCIILTAGIMFASDASALDTFLVGARAAGMGGANVASVNNATAQYYNPAAFAFFGYEPENHRGRKVAPMDNNNLASKDWGLEVEGGAGYRQQGNFGEYLDELANVDLDLLSTNGIQTPEDLEKVIAIANSLQGLDEPGNGIVATVRGGAAIRILHFGIGVRAYTQFSGQVLNVDTSNLGFTANLTDVQEDIVTVSMPTEYDDTTYTIQVFTQDQVDILAAAMGDPTYLDPNTIDAIKRLDYIAYTEEISTSDIDGVVTVLDETLTQTTTSTGDLAANTTSVRLGGVGFYEVPISYGYAFNDWIGMGVNLKLMNGRVYGNQVAVFGEDSGDIIKQTDEFYADTNAFGVDVGLLARASNFQFGLMARNINSPTFDGPSILVDGQTIDFDDVELKPQVTAGLAFIPTETLTFEVDYDLTENETIIPGYKTQNYSVGFEWNMLHFIAIRAGFYKNLAETDIGMVYTAGLGVNLWAARLDISGSFSEESQQFDNKDVPEEVNVVAQLSIDF